MVMIELVLYRLSGWIKTTLHLLDSRLLTTRWLVFLDFVSPASQPCLALISSQGTHLNASQHVSTRLAQLNV